MIVTDEEISEQFAKCSLALQGYGSCGTLQIR